MDAKNKEEFRKKTGDALEKAFQAEMDDCLNGMKNLPLGSQKLAKEMLGNPTISLVCKNFFYAGANHGAETAAAMVKDFINSNKI